MKNKDVDQLASIVKTLCREIEEPWAIARFHWLMIGLVELAREGKAFKALDIAFEASAYLVMEAEKTQKQEKPVGTPVGIGTSAPSTPITFEPTTHAWWQKPVATIDQMRAAADAAMAADDELIEWQCDGCHKTTLIPDGDLHVTPPGWSEKFNEDTGELQHFCNECTSFGVPGDK